MLSQIQQSRRLQYCLINFDSMHNPRRRTKVQDATFKIIMVGKSSVGKSSLLIRYTQDIFHKEYMVTVGVQFATKIIKINQNFSIKMTIWDTAGQESFKSIIKTYYRNSSAVFLVFDITNKDSFLSLNGWLSEALENAPHNVMIVLIGTHLDEAQKRQVQREQVEAWMKENNIELFFETSSKTAENVKQAFEEVAKQLFNQRMVKTKASLSTLTINNVVRLEEEDKQKKSNCCNK